jgi:hypothetical protein
VLYFAACSVMDFLRATHVQCSGIGAARERAITARVKAK